MNLDPLDIFGETIFSPILRAVAFFFALVLGAWLGGLACFVDDFIQGYGHRPDFAGVLLAFLYPLRLLLSSAAILVVGGLLLFVFLPAHHEKLLALAVLGSSAFFLHDAEATGIGWAVWVSLNLGIVGAIVTVTIYRRNRWVVGLAELRAANALERRSRAEEYQQKTADAATEPASSPPDEA